MTTGIPIKAQIISLFFSHTDELTRNGDDFLNSSCQEIKHLAEKE